jgi:endoglucanase
MRGIRRLLVVVSCLALAVASAPGAVAGDSEDLYMPKPSLEARVQIADLVSRGDKEAAAMVEEMISTPQAFWVETTDPAATMRDVRATVKRAAAKNQIPVLVAYNIPFRDCAQFSAGGATTVEEYTAWIDGVAAGIGSLSAVVILEPDGLGIIPWYTNIDGNLEWCQPAEADPGDAAAERFSMLNYAVDALKAKPNVAVYLDGTHSGWLNVGDISDRLVEAGVDRADGFYLNASNYQFTTNQVQYGTWISKCIADGDFAGCPNQYWNGGPPGTMIADLLGPWNGVALSSFGEWSDTATDPGLNTSGINARYEGMDTGPHFVIDTSRNGVGPWDPSTSAHGPYPDAQDWCNPPDRGLGLTPTFDTGSALVDVYLWIKTPGESDGECTRGLGPAGETVDPEWGLIDPGAGDWFSEQVLDLVANANPPMEGVWPYKG